MEEHNSSSRRRNSDAAPHSDDRGYLCIPRDVIEHLLSEPDLLALLVMLAASARYRELPGKAPKGARLQQGQLATSKRAIAVQFGWTESRAHRGLHRLRERDVIALQANRHGTIVTVCDYKRYRPKKRTRRTESEPEADRSRTDPEPETDRKRTPTKEEINKQSPPPTPSFASDADSAAWEGVEAELQKLGVSQAGRAIAEAQRRGLALNDAEQLIAEYRDNSGAWSPGALFGRFTGDLSAWPSPNSAFAARQATARATDEQEKRRHECEKRLQQRAADDARLAALEARHGEEFDRLEMDEQRELFQAAFGDASELEWRRRASAGRMTAPQRLQVLGAMELQGVT